MKLNRIGIKDFKKIEDLKLEFGENPVVLVGPNGAGKSSVVEAIRYAITGESPLNAIRAGEKESIITVIANDDIEFERYIQRLNKKSVKLMGKKITNSAAKITMEDVLDIGTEETDIILTSDILKLKPNELGSLFFKHDHRMINVDGVLKIMEASEPTTKKSAVLIKESDKFPADVIGEVKSLLCEENVDLDMLQKAHDEAKSKKSEYSAQYKILSVKANDFEGMARPMYDTEKLNKDLEDIIGVEKNAAISASLLKNYNDAIRNQANQEKMIISLELQEKIITASKPDEEELKKIKAAIEELARSINQQEVVKRTLLQNIKNTKNILEALDKPVCPISKKLICTTDKMPAKTELSGQLHDAEESVSNVEEMITSLKKQLENEKKKEEEYKQNKINFERKENLKKQIETLKKNPIRVPEKPVVAKIRTNLAEEKKKIYDILNQIKKFDEAEKYYREAIKVKRKIKIYDYIMEAFDTKGPVVMAFLKATAEALEKKTKERAKIFNKDLDVKFDVAEGLKPYFKFGKTSSFQTYYSLSTGQKIIASMLITDILNFYCGSKLLILDELNDLDEKNFESVMKFITDEDVRSDYDNIIVCTVDHTNLLNVAKRYDVDCITLS